MVRDWPTLLKAVKAITPSGGAALGMTEPLWIAPGWLALQSRKGSAVSKTILDRHDPICAALAEFFGITTQISLCDEANYVRWGGEVHR